MDAAVADGSTPGLFLVPDGAVTVTGNTGRAGPNIEAMPGVQRAFTSYRLATLEGRMELLRVRCWRGEGWV